MVEGKGGIENMVDRNQFHHLSRPESCLLLRIYQAYSISIMGPAEEYTDGKWSGPLSYYTKSYRESSQKLYRVQSCRSC
jgi:hypothetical protein